MTSFTEEASDLLALPLYPPEECRPMVGHIKDLEYWSDATVRERGQDNLFRSVSREARLASILSLNSLPDISSRFEEKMANIIKPLIRQFWGADLQMHSGSQIVRYQPGGRYQAHQDAALDFENRYFTVICYLNDDFEGGRTQFPNLDHAVTPEPGKAIIFPAKYFHCAEPVTAGQKYVLVAWVLGPVPIKWI